MFFPVLNDGVVDLGYEESGGGGGGGVIGGVVIC